VTPVGHGVGVQSVPALDAQPPKNWSGVFVLRPQWVQLQLLSSASVPAPHTRIGESPQLVLPLVVETEHADGPVPAQFRASSVQ
jgi:hypothetical protein